MINGYPDTIFKVFQIVFKFPYLHGRVNDIHIATVVTCMHIHTYIYCSCKIRWYKIELVLESLWLHV